MKRLLDWIEYFKYRLKLLESPEMQLKDWSRFDAVKKELGLTPSRNEDR